MKVSIILPVHNGGQYLVPCLESLRAQSLQECEVVCVDDGSADGSGRVLDGYQEKYPGRFRVFHTRNQGVYQAREMGIQEAIGEYVGFCDCDDRADSRMYEELYQCAAKAGAEMAVCAYERIDAESGKALCREMGQFGNQVLRVGERRDQLAVVNTALWNKLVRRDIAIGHIHFQDAPRVAEDMMFLLSIYPDISRIAFCPKPLYHYYVRKGTAMGHVSPEEVAHLQRCMLMTARYVRQRQDGWEDVLSLFAFIHFGVSLPLRMAGQASEKQPSLQKETKKWLDRNFKGWRENQYLKVSYVAGGHRYLAKPMLLQYIYCLGLFPVFLKAYLWVTGRLKIDIKW